MEKKRSSKKIKGKEAYEILNLKMQIESEKTLHKRLVETIIDYAFIDCCTAASYFNNLFHESLQQGYRAIEDCGLDNEKKSELRRMLMPLFGKECTPKQKYQDELNYQKKLNEWLKISLNQLPTDKKIKIIEECAKQQNLWSTQSSHTYKVINKIEEFKNVKSSPKKKS